MMVKMKGRGLSSLLFFERLDILLVVCILFSYFLIYNNQSVEVSKQESRHILLPVEQLKKITFGYDFVIADSLWLNVIQNYEFCENDASKAYNPQKDAIDALGADLKPSRCHKGWIFQAIDTITDLDPRFRKAYDVGALMLSIGVDDREGARLIFEKGVKQFPERWQLAYQAAYHYLFEVQDAARAADLLLQASQYGGPVWLPILAARLYTNSGRKVLGQSVLQDFIKTNPESWAVKRAEERLQEISSATE